ncbi:MAG: substrate-binding domain-containing protein [Armatimonadetes bacterium]|nr:substrate-binding domain-containing protein [Armatimonadota bacterium]
MPSGEALPAATQPATGPIKLAVIPKGTTHEFWKSIHAGALKAGKELGVEIVWKGPLKEDNRDDQIKIVEDMTSAKMSGIVLAPLDDTALRAPVAAAKAKGVPVVIIDSGLKSEDFVSFVATDNKHGGELAGEELARLLGGKGKVVMLRYQEGSASTNEREAGFMEAIAKAPGLTVVSSNQYGGATTESAYAASENVLAPLQKDGKLAVDGIFCPNESTTFGMLRALQDGGFAGKVKFIGFDSSPKLVQALQDKQLNALVLQDPMNMGYLGVKTMVQHLRGEKVEARISTGETLVTPENMDEAKIQALLSPDFKSWLGE